MEEPVQFPCNGKSLYGILHLPDNSDASLIVLTMVIGGPQTRVGSHRLYVQLARYLYEQGITVLRFDYEGLGDSDGNFVGYENAGPSITSAINFLSGRFPESSRSILWSLCDGSSAISIYAGGNPEKIAGLILCNPNIIVDEKDLSQTVLKHYYARRFFEMEFWKKLLSLRVNIIKTFRSLSKVIGDAKFPFRCRVKSLDNDQDLTLPERVIEGIIGCGKPVKCILSADDLAANNFLDFIKRRKKIKKIFDEREISRHLIYGADHTFTEPLKKEELFKTTLKAIHEIEAYNITHCGICQ